MATRVFLGGSALLWISYGLFCFFVPSSLEMSAGVAISNPTASIELRAMYGGLQVAVGLIAVSALLRPSFRRSGLSSLALLTGGLGVARLLGAVVDGEFSLYTSLALAFEYLATGIALWLLCTTDEV